MSDLQHILDVLNDAPGISDSRMNGFLTKSPLQFVIILATYFFIIFKIAPNFMKNRKPYSLQYVIVCYNVLQIMLNVALFMMIFPVWRKLSCFCSPHSTSNDDFNLQEVRVHYFYILLKFLDLVETFFFVLRKKHRQVSFLHVYHHIGILLAAWISGKYFPGGQAIFVGFYNTLIHSIMYCYYLFASLHVSEKFLWWKKYLTAIQIVQHILIFLNTFPAVANPNCTYPKFLMGLFSVNVLFNTYLFVQFYRRSYLKENKD